MQKKSDMMLEHLRLSYPKSTIQLKHLLTLHLSL